MELAQWGQLSLFRLNRQICTCLHINTGVLSVHPGSLPCVHQPRGHGAYVYWWCVSVILKPTFPAWSSAAHMFFGVNAQSTAGSTSHKVCALTPHTSTQLHFPYPSPTSILPTYFILFSLFYLVSQAKNKSITPDSCLSALTFKAKPRSHLTIFTIYLIPDLQPLVKVIATKPDNLSYRPGPTYWVEETL